MGALTEAELTVLAQLYECWADVPCVLVGGAALALQTTPWRTTADLDLVVALGKDEFASDLDRLSGWSRGRHEHEWIGPGSVRVDIVPARASYREQGSVTWSHGGRMSLLGVRTAFENAERMELRKGLSIAVAPLASIAVLKMVAYQDRPSERRRDLIDIAFLLDRYLSEDDDRYYSGVIEKAPDLAFDETPAFVLGHDIGSMIDDREEAAVDRFLQVMEADGHPQMELLRAGPWRQDIEHLARRLRALRRGKDAGRSMGMREER